MSTWYALQQRKKLHNRGKIQNQFCNVKSLLHDRGNEFEIRNNKETSFLLVKGAAAFKELTYRYLYMYMCVYIYMWRSTWWRPTSFRIKWHLRLFACFIATMAQRICTPKCLDSALFGGLYIIFISPQHAKCFFSNSTSVWQQAGLTAYKHIMDG